MEEIPPCPRCNSTSVEKVGAGNVLIAGLVITVLGFILGSYNRTLFIMSLLGLYLIFGVVTARSKPRCMCRKCRHTWEF